MHQSHINHASITHQSCINHTFCTNGTIPTNMYLHSLHELQFPACIPITIMYLNSLYSLPSLCGFSSLHGYPPPPCTYIDSVHCIHCVGSIHCMHPHHHVPTFTVFTAWIPFTVWVPTTTMFLHSLHSLCGFNSPVWVIFCTKNTVPTTVYIYCILHRVHFTVWPFYTKGSDLFVPRTQSPPPYTYIYYVLHGSKSLHVVPTTNIHCVHCMDSIPCVDNLFALTSGPHNWSM